MNQRIFIFFCLLLLMGTEAFSQKSKSVPRYDAYLFAYFEGKVDPGVREQLRFAVSEDAITWSALNLNEPIISSASITKTGGLRDPHLLRAEGGNQFFITATDMFANKNGWDSNPGIVMMQSPDLLNWHHHIIDLAKDYPKKFGNVKWVWAPQTIYDPSVKKYMVYFTIRFHNSEKLDFYYAYANKNFSGFESEPRLLFSPKYGGIDGDIILKDGVYHFFYKGNTKNKEGKEIRSGIQQAVSRSLQGPWKEELNYLDAYSAKNISVEGSSVFKLNNAEDYVLMYDLYRDGRFEFQRSKDLVHFTDSAQSFHKNFNPRHGSVIGITREEARRLSNKWVGVPPSIIVPQQAGDQYHFQAKGNPIIKHLYTGDPAAMVEKDTLWLFTGHDFAGDQKGYKMKDWLVFSTTDLKNWTQYPVSMNISDFPWATSGAAWAGQTIKRDGKYYWYFSTNWTGIGVGVADRPEGPYKDALGKPLLTNKDCFASTHGWACIDPSVFIDNDGQAWLFWGNRECYYAKLKKNMIELDGPVHQVKFDGFSFTEAPWVHKKDGIYYLSYATGFPEKIAYATASNIAGPYKYQGILNELAGNCNTNHQAILEYKGKWYFVYHNGGIETGGGSFSRSVCIDKLEYEPDGRMKRVLMTTEGVQK